MSKNSDAENYIPDTAKNAGPKKDKNIPNKSYDIKAFQDFLKTNRLLVDKLDAVMESGGENYLEEASTIREVHEAARRVGLSTEAKRWLMRRYGLCDTAYKTMAKVDKVISKLEDEARRTLCWYLNNENKSKVERICVLAHEKEVRPSKSSGNFVGFTVEDGRFMVDLGMTEGPIDIMDVTVKELNKLVDKPVKKRAPAGKVSTPQVATAEDIQLNYQKARTGLQHAIEILRSLAPDSVELVELEELLQALPTVRTSTNGEELQVEAAAGGEAQDQIDQAKAEVKDQAEDQVEDQVEDESMDQDDAESPKQDLEDQFSLDLEPDSNLDGLDDSDFDIGGIPMVADSLATETDAKAEKKRPARNIAPSKNAHGNTPYAGGAF